MPSTRIRGQENATIIVVNNVPQLQTTDIKSCEFTFQLEVQKEGYLGEFTDRRDSIYRGITGKQEYHFENPSWMNIVQQAVQRAQRRTPGIQLNTKSTINYSSGQKTRIVINDFSPGEIPITFSDRASFATLAFPFEAEDAQLTN
jgi:hypothetical protein